LAGAALEDDEIVDADELARDRDGVGGRATAIDVADLLADTVSHTAWAAFIFDDHFFAATAAGVERMDNTVGSTLEAAAEGVVFTLVVVVTHVFAARLVDLDVFFFDSDFFGRPTAFVLDVVCRISTAAFALDVVCRISAAAFVLDVVGRIDAAAVVALGDVELGLEGLVSYLSTIDFDVVLSIASAVAAFDIDVDLAVLVLDRLSVATGRRSARVFGSTNHHDWLKAKHVLHNRRLHGAQGMDRNTRHTVLGGARLLGNDHVPRGRGCRLHVGRGERC
jgi:hypothetical protein